MRWQRRPSLQPTMACRADADVLAALIAEHLAGVVDGIRSSVLQAMAVENANLTERLVNAVRHAATEDHGSGEKHNMAPARHPPLLKSRTRPAQAHMEEMTKTLSVSSSSCNSVRRLQAQVASQLLESQDLQHTRRKEKSAVSQWSVGLVFPGPRRPASPPVPLGSPPIAPCPSRPVSPAGSSDPSEVSEDEPSHSASLASYISEDHSDPGVGSGGPSGITNVLNIVPHQDISAPNGRMPSAPSELLHQVCREPPTLNRPEGPSKVEDRASSPRGHGPRRQGLKRLHKQRVTELTREITRETQDQPDDEFQKALLPRHFLLLPKICGIVPWDFRVAPQVWWLRCPFCYRWGICMLVFLALGASVSQVVYSLSSQKTDLFQPMVLLSDLPIALGAFAGLVALEGFCSKSTLGNSYLMLHTYVNRTGCISIWTRRSCLDLTIAIVFLVCAVGERLRGNVAFEATADPRLRFWLVVRVSAFAVSSTILVALTFNSVHICNALRVVIDTFCTDITNQGQLHEAVHKWNIIQSVVQESSGRIELSMFSLQLTAGGAVLLAAVDFWLGKCPVSALIPNALLACMLIFAFLRAAAVTDECARVPALVNALFFGEHLDLNRQYVVEYIRNSAAGFYIFEVRINQAMVLKMIHTMGVVLFALCTMRV